MKVLNNIRLENIVAIDIETVRIEDQFSDLNEGTQMAWEYKNKQDGVVPTFDELSEKWVQYASLYAEFSQVCAVSLAFMHNGKLYCKEFYGDNEHELLKSLYVTLENIHTRGKEYRLVGHASKYFDYPFLCKRFVINGLDIPNILDATALKPWEQANLCTLELWKMGGTGLGSSLQALCNVLQIPVSKVDLVGDEVGKAFYDKEYERIGRYCSLDTVATYNLVARFKKDKVFEFDEVNYVVTYPSDVVEEKIEVSPLVKLYESDYFSDELKNNLSNTFSKKKLTKKDKEFIQSILEDVYIKTAFMKEDSPDVKESKKNEIEDFLRSI